MQVSTLFSEVFEIIIIVKSSGLVQVYKAKVLSCNNYSTIIGYNKTGDIQSEFITTISNKYKRDDIFSQLISPKVQKATLDAVIFNYYLMLDHYSISNDLQLLLSNAWLPFNI